MDTCKRNKMAAQQFYTMMFVDNNPEQAIAEYAGKHYIQHNPLVKDGKEGFIEYFTRMNALYPNKQIHFKRVFAEGDHVVLHCHQVWPGDEFEHWATIDIFRFDQHGKIVEHWDVVQPVPEQSMHSNGMF